jgi:hypothetical protein
LRAADLSNGGYGSQEVSGEGVVADVEVRDEAAVHDELPLQVVHHTEAHPEPHENVNPVEQTCIATVRVAIVTLVTSWKKMRIQGRFHASKVVRSPSGTA